MQRTQFLSLVYVNGFMDPLEIARIISLSIDSTHILLLCAIVTFSSYFILDATLLIDLFVRFQKNYNKNLSI